MRFETGTLITTGVVAGGYHYLYAQPHWNAYFAAIARGKAAHQDGLNAPNIADQATTNANRTEIAARYDARDEYADAFDADLVVGGILALGLVVAAMAYVSRGSQETATA